MSLLPPLRNPASGALLVLACSATLSAGAVYAPQGGEFALLDDPRGDQVRAAVALAPGGGWSYVAWEDNATDGNGQGISSRLLDQTLQGAEGRFRINWTLGGDQQRPAVGLLSDRSCIFAYQSRVASGQDRILAVVLSPFVTLASDEVMVSGFAAGSQSEPAVAGLADGNAAVVWTSLNQEGVGNRMGVYGQLLSPEGDKIGAEFHVNQFVPGNQKSAAVAGLPDGRFLVAWVSEQQRSERSVDIYARFFTAAGTPVGSEFLVNTSTNLCGPPSVAVLETGAFTIVWAERDIGDGTATGFDIQARSFSASGLSGAPYRLNTGLSGDQHSPKIAAAGSEYMCVWTSVGQDGDLEGVYGRFIDADGLPDGAELRANTTTSGRQMDPTVAADGSGRFLVVWSSFVGSSFDLLGQRFSSDQQALPAPAAPFVSALDSSKMMASWLPPVTANIVWYEVYADNSTTPTAVQTNHYWVMSGLASGTTHTFKLAYVLADGRRSPLSASAMGRTWGADVNGDAIPDDWQIAYWGSAGAPAARPKVDADGDGVSNYDEFLAGTDPTSAQSVLRTQVRRAGTGLEIAWSSVPGLVYQVQRTSSLSVLGWQDLGLPMVASGVSSSAGLGQLQPGFYRVKRVR